MPGLAFVPSSGRGVGSATARVRASSVSELASTFGIRHDPKACQLNTLDSTSQRPLSPANLVGLFVSFQPPTPSPETNSLNQVVCEMHRPQNIDWRAKACHLD